MIGLLEARAPQGAVVVGAGTGRLSMAGAVAKHFERVEVLERAVALEKQLEDLIAQQYRAGVGPGSPAEVLRVKARRLQVEIDLEKAKARLAAPTK